MSHYFSAIASILSPEALINEVLPGFAVGEVAECQLYSTGFNHTYRVKAADGRTFYLRAYRIHWRTLDDIRYELDLLNHLKHKGFPAAQPVRYRDGQYLSAVPAAEGQRYLALFTEAPGREVSYDREPEEAARRLTIWTWRRSRCSCAPAIYGTWACTPRTLRTGGSIF